MKKLSLVIVLPIVVIAILVIGLIVWRTQQLGNQALTTPTQSLPQPRLESGTKPQNGFSQYAKPTPTGIQSTTSEMTTDLNTVVDDSQSDLDSLNAATSGL
jgi:hypothetical protein